MRILTAAGLALCLFGAWVAVLWRIYHFGLGTSDVAGFSLAAGGAALVALSARLARRSRWAVGGLLLLALEVVGGFFALLGAAWDAPGVAGLVAGLLTALIIGPAVLVFRVEESEAESGRMPAAALPTQSRSRMSRFGPLLIGLGVPVILVAFPLVPAGACYLRLSLVRRDLLPAVEELIRTDVLVHPGPTVWAPVRSEWAREQRECARGYVNNLRAGSEGGVPGLTVSLGTLRERPARQFGRTGKAEGLKVDGLSISFPLGVAIEGREAEQLPVAKRLLLSAGVRPELVSGLASRKPMGLGSYVVTRNGVTYAFSFLDTDGRKVTIACSGVRVPEK